MQYRVTIEGTRPVIMHNGAAGLDVRSPANVEKAEIAAKKGSNRTVVDEGRLRQLECETSFWLNESLAPTIPPSAIQAVIEAGARKLRQGSLVREGLVVAVVQSFDYDRDRYGTSIKELSVTTQFTAAVVVQRSRILRTRARFDEWSCTFVVDVDDELVDQEKLDHWLDIGGRRIGLGDWRPERSGIFGRFEVGSIAPVV
jgi:hypothetical protein